MKMFVHFSRRRRSRLPLSGTVCQGEGAEMRKGGGVRVV